MKKKHCHTPDIKSSKFYQTGDPEYPGKIATMKLIINNVRQGSYKKDKNIYSC